MSESTTIKISRKLWKRLTERKEWGDTFEDVITRLLDNDEEEAQLKEEEAQAEEQGLIKIPREGFVTPERVRWLIKYGQLKEEDYPQLKEKPKPKDDEIVEL